MIEIDKETAVFILTYLQKKSDKQAGLKIQNINLKKEIRKLNNQLLKLETKNTQLAKELTALHHEYQKLNKLYNQDIGGAND